MKSTSQRYTRWPAAASRSVRGAAVGVLVGVLIWQAGCDRRIYVVDGVTDGDQFYILPEQLDDESPAHQSWISYSLVRSACQLNVESANPSRNTSYECELSGREALVSTWRAYQDEPAVRDDYLDTLLDVANAGFLREYTWVFFHDESWEPPDALDLDSFNAWRQVLLEDHQPQTRLVGAWI